MNAMVDTGASTSCIPLTVVSNLGLVPMGTINLVTTSGPGDAAIYLVEIEIEHLGTFNQTVVGLEFDTVLLGRDILSEFSVLIRGDGGMSFFRKQPHYPTPATTP